MLQLKKWQKSIIKLRRLTTEKSESDVSTGPLPAIQVLLCRLSLKVTTRKMTNLSVNKIKKSHQIFMPISMQLIIDSQEML